MGGISLLGLISILISLAFASQNQYKINLENSTLDLIDHHYLDAGFEIVQVNETSAIKGYFVRKTQPSDNTRIYIKGYKWLIDDYRLLVLQIDKPMKDIFEMELFDLQNLFIMQARPPIIWPLEKGVTYRIPAWIPDSSKSPPNLPDGKWKIKITEMVSKTTTLVWSWFINIKYNK